MSVHARKRTAHGTQAASQADGLRLFFALLPKPALRMRLVQHMALWHFAPPARLVLPDKLHMTVLFMDQVPEARLRDVVALGRRVAAEHSRIKLELDVAAVWRQGGIAHLAPAHVPKELQSLHDGLLDGATVADLPHDHRALRPHITLARRAELMRPPEAFEPVAWAVDQLALVQSMLGTGRYSVLDKSALRDTYACH